MSSDSLFLFQFSATPYLSVSFFLPLITVRFSALQYVFCYIGYFLAFCITQGQRDGEVEEEKREKPKATFEGEKLKELTESEADVIGDVINPNGLPVQNGLDVDVKEFG